jgi:hypothetical protein
LVKNQGYYEAFLVEKHGCVFGLADIHVDGTLDAETYRMKLNEYKAHLVFHVFELFIK